MNLMKKEERIEWAKETVSICDTGFYMTPGGRRIELKTQIEAAVNGTILYSPENHLESKKDRPVLQTVFEVKNETTCDALARLVQAGGHVGCLNFASARNPGGGFLTGAQAQEEALARCSALYPCLLKTPEYYERNRAHRSAIYLDLLIYSPLVPFFRNDAGVLLERPFAASVITAPAPNAGAVLQNEPKNAPSIEPALRRRAELVLTVAHTRGIDSLVLGAWGCGVFRNEPIKVAKIFAEFLTLPGKFAGAFSRVTFAVLDRSEEAPTYRAFAQVFNRNS
jgi:uncharacterized protein (TIGR02452 family)